MLKAYKIRISLLIFITYFHFIVVIPYRDIFIHGNDYIGKYKGLEIIFALNYELAG